MPPIIIIIIVITLFLYFDSEIFEEKTIKRSRNPNGKRTEMSVFFKNIYSVDANFWDLVDSINYLTAVTRYSFIFCKAQYQTKLTLKSLLF